MSAQRASSKQSRRRRWWRMILLSAVIQCGLIAAAWLTVEKFAQIRAHSDAPIEAGLSSDTTEAADEDFKPPTEVLEKSDPLKSIVSPSQPSLQTQSKQPNKLKKPTGTEPLASDSQTNPQANQQLGSQTTLANNTPLTTKADANTAQANSNTATSSAENSLTSVPITLQTIHYQVQLQSGAAKPSTKLPPARLQIQSLGAQRYHISISNGTATQGEGNFAWFNTFLNTEYGPQPLEIGGGLYLKSDAQPALKLALGLGLNEDGQSWYWGKKANISPRTHRYFLDRVSLIGYIQGMLQQKGVTGNARWILPLSSEHAVRDTPVSLTNTAPPNGNIHCNPCVNAQVRANLGEMSRWSVWYDGSRNWRPVAMQMSLRHDGQLVLLLSEQ